MAAPIREPTRFGPLDIPVVSSTVAGNRIETAMIGTANTIASTIQAPNRIQNPA